jgi:uncharacterized protein YqgC (DUF456 family)
MDLAFAGLMLVGVLLAVAGFAGLLLPALPGAPLLFLGLVCIAWAEDFAYAGGWTLGVLAVLAALTYVIDVIAGLLGARRFGASPRALWGAGIGGLVGIFFGLFGVLLGPLIGACIGQLTTVPDLLSAGRAGIGAALGLVIGAALKIAVAVTMVGIFVLARLS